MVNEQEVLEQTTDKTIYFFARDGDFQWIFTFYSLFSLSIVKIQFGLFRKNDAIEIINDRIKIILFFV